MKSSLVGTLILMCVGTIGAFIYSGTVDGTIFSAATLVVAGIFVNR